MGSVIGEWVIQDDSEWDEYVSTQLTGWVPVSESMLETPVDLTQKTLLIKVNGDLLLDTSGYVEYTPNEICFSPDQVTVHYDMDEQCPTGWYFVSASTMMFAIDKTDLPVVWEGTFYPYDGPPCEPVTFIPFDPLDPPLIPYNQYFSGPARR